MRRRRAVRILRGVLAAVAVGAAAVGFGRLCDAAAGLHAALARAAPLAGLAVLPVALVAAAWTVRRFAREAGGGGIAQVVAAADDPAPPRPDPRISLRTALFSAGLSLLLFAAGASIGPEGPTVQLAAATAAALARSRGLPRRALLAAGGGAGLAAAFNAPLAGAMFAAEELVRDLNPRAARVVLMGVAGAAAAAWRLSGDYVYFGHLRVEALGSAWLAAPLAGLAGGLIGGLFARALKNLAGPRPGPIGRFRAARPLAFSAVCAGAAVAATAASGGLTYGPGSPETRALLEGAPARGLFFTPLKWVATLAAAAAGGPGGLMSPVLAIGAGAGSALSGVLPFADGRDVVVLAMAGCLIGVTQAPFTGVVLVMELTREPSMAGPLIVAAVVAQFVSARAFGRPLQHALAEAWATRRGRGGGRAPVC